MQKTILSWGFFALASISFAPMLQAQKKEPNPTTTKHSSTSWWGNHQYMNIDVDSSATPPQIIATYKNDALYNMTISQHQLTSLYINGRLIPADSFYLYDDLVKRIMDQMRRDSVQAIRDREQAVRDKAQAERDAKQALLDRDQAVRDKQQAERDAEQAVRDKAQAERDAKQADLDKIQAEKEALDAKMEAERDAKQALLDKDQAVRDKAQAERDAEQAVRDKKQAELDRQQAIRDKKQAEEDRALLKSLLADVVKEGLAPDEKSIVSLVLNESEFLVNGKKQSDALQKQFAEKYVRSEGFGFYIHGKVTQIGRMN